MNSELLSVFCELLQVAVGNRDQLTFCPSNQDWAMLYVLCKRQSLLGIGFAGISRLPDEQRPPLKQQAQWFHDAEKIKRKNARLTEMCSTVSMQMTHDKLWNCILKGQSNLVNYPEWLRDYRTPGDIDIWCAPIDKTETAPSDNNGAEHVAYSGERGVIEYALMQAKLAGSAKPEVRYHHTAMGHNMGDVEVEIHHRPSFMCSPLRNIRLRKWCRQYKGMSYNANVDSNSDLAFPVPTPSFNAVYQLVHIYRHLFDEGIGLRQLLDYYFVLKALSLTEVTSIREEGKDYRNEIMHTLSQLGMYKFSSAVMWVLQRAFAMRDEFLLCKPNEKEGEFLLHEIMMAGNFGKYDKRIHRGGNAIHRNWEKLKHNFRLLNHYPNEVMWEPFFRLYHFFWRKLELWRF